MKDRRLTVLKRIKEKTDLKTSKPTVASLMDTTRKLPHLTLKPQDPIKDKDLDVSQIRVKKKVTHRPRISSLFNKGSDSMLSDSRGDDDSPTRRLNRKDVAIKKDLLGAGYDPLAKEQDFSVHAKNAKDLMNVSFLKPPVGKIRFPPILDYSSRTIASPITSVGRPIPLIHKIGSHYSPMARGLVIHQQSKHVVALPVVSKNTFEFLAEYLEPIATEEEELEYLCLREYSKERRVQAKRRSYDRYMAYIDNEITRDHVAEMRKYWVTNMIQQLP